MKSGRIDPIQWFLLIAIVLVIPLVLIGLWFERQPREIHGEFLEREPRYRWIHTVSPELNPPPRGAALIHISANGLPGAVFIWEFDCWPGFYVPGIAKDERQWLQLSREDKEIRIGFSEPKPGEPGTIRHEDTDVSLDFGNVVFVSCDGDLVPIDIFVPERKEVTEYRDLLDSLFDEGGELEPNKSP